MWMTHCYSPQTGYFMASILKIGDRWWAQVRRRGQSIAKTFRTKGAAEAWAREIEGGIDKGHGTVDEQTITVGELVRLYRSARNDSGRAVAERSNEDYMLKRLESHFDDEVAAKLSTKRLVKFAQDRKRGRGSTRSTWTFPSSGRSTSTWLRCSI